MKGDTGENLIGLLERRLDTVVYRASSVPHVRRAPVHQPRPHQGERPPRQHFKLQAEARDLVEIKEPPKQLTRCWKQSQLGERDVPDFIESRSLQDVGEVQPHPRAVGRAVRGADGAASDRRILFALIGLQSRNIRGPGKTGAFLLMSDSCYIHRCRRRLTNRPASCLPPPRRKPRLPLGRPPSRRANAPLSRDVEASRLQHVHDRHSRRHSGRGPTASCR